MRKLVTYSNQVYTKQREAIDSDMWTLNGTSQSCARQAVSVLQEKSFFSRKERGGGSTTGEHNNFT